MKIWERRGWLAAFVLSVGFFCIPGAALMSRSAEGTETSDLMASVSEGTTNLDGSFVLTEDCTIPEGVELNVVEGALIIREGVTLTLSDNARLLVWNSLLEIEEGGTLRIEGEEEYKEYIDRARTQLEGRYIVNVPDMAVEVHEGEVRIDGTLESSKGGLYTAQSTLRLNGSVHTQNYGFYLRECDIRIEGGAYFSEQGIPFLNCEDSDFKSIIEVRGGSFSTVPDNISLADGLTMVTLEDGSSQIIKSEEDTRTLTDRIKELAQSAWSQRDDKDASFWMWAVLGLGVLLVLLYVIVDFIRSPWKKKLKSLVVLAVVAALVGGMLKYFWDDAMKQNQEAKNYAYSEENVPEKKLIENENSQLNGLEAYPPGTYLVGTDLEPGVYFAEADNLVESDWGMPYKIYFSEVPDFEERSIGAWCNTCYVELVEGQYIRVVDANLVKAGEESACEPDSGEQGMVYEKGFFLVGRDIEPGVWQFETTQDITMLYVWDAPGKSSSYNWSECSGYRAGYECEGETQTVELSEGQYLQLVYGKARAVKSE